MRVLSIVLLWGVLAAPGVAAQEGPALAAGQAVLEARLPEGAPEALREGLAEMPEGATAATLGHLLYARRHWDEAAWAFAEAALEGGGGTDLSNAAALLSAVHAAAPDPALAAAALAAGEAAVAGLPEVAAAWNALARAALAAGDPARAVEAARRAVALAPEEPLYHANLARALAAAGDMAGAAEALAAARALAPNGMAYIAARAALPQDLPAPAGAEEICAVDFRCQEICPKSIIGGIQSVTCEMENMNAQMACRDGLPFPVAYDCREKLPEYGILIPGLNAGFSACAPGFCVHVLVDGEGNVDMRVEAGVSAGPLSVYLRADGHYSPDGGVSFDNYGGGVRLSLLNSKMAQAAGEYGHPPAHIEIEGLEGRPAEMTLESYNKGLISM